MTDEKKKEKRVIRTRDEITAQVNKTGANQEYLLEVLLDIRDLLGK